MPPVAAITRFRERLQQELSARRAKNARYSLRAFAVFLGDDHSTLSQVLRGTRKPTTRQIRAWSRRLGLEQEEAAAYIAAEHLPGEAATRRENQLRHWAAEAMAVATQPVHWQIVRLSRSVHFSPDCRRIARQAGVTVDDVNIALQRLLRLRLLATTSKGKWVDRTSPRARSEAEFRRQAMAQVRKLAAEDRVRLPPARIAKISITER
jgi:transcriptional regulator with XRE-family HTH domain